MKSIIKYLLIISISLTSIQNTFADNIPPKPSPFALVNDYAGLLSAQGHTILTNQLNYLNNNTQTQICIVVLNKIDDDISQYAVKLGRAWGIGEKESNSGVLILILKEQRKMWVATGYGMEGVLPDATCKKIIEEYIKPFFKQELYAEGLQNGVISIVSALLKNETNQNSDKAKHFKALIENAQNNIELGIETKKQAPKKLSWLEIILILVIMGSIFSIFFFGNKKGGRPSFMGPIILGSLAGRGYGSYSGGSSFGSGGSFGGGSFGGGGAGGSW